MTGQYLNSATTNVIGSDWSDHQGRRPPKLLHRRDARVVSIVIIGLLFKFNPLFLDVNVSKLAGTIALKQLLYQGILITL